MTNTVWPINAVTGAPSYNGKMIRQAQSAMLGGATAARPLGAQSGVRPGTPTTTVTATSTVWTVNPHSGILDVEASAVAGPYGYAIDAAVTGAVTAADATYPRVDIVWVRIDDPSEDGSAAPALVPGYTAGTPAATPSAPATPARCMVLATINVPKSGTGSPTVVWSAPVCASAGGVFINPPTAQQTALDAIATAAAPIYIDNGTGLMRSVGAGFVSAALVGQAAENQPTSETVVAAASGGETLVAQATITAAPAGTYLAIGAIAAYTSGSNVAGYARFYKGATLMRERRNDLLSGAGPTQEHSCLIAHTGGDLTVGVVVYTAATAYNVQPKGCGLTLTRVA